MIKSMLTLRSGIEKPPPNEDTNLMRARESQGLNEAESLNFY